MDLVAATRAFISVAERGSFTLGAAALRVPQPVVSRRVAALENHLGAKLLERSPRSAALTSVGRDVITTANALVQIADQFEGAAQRSLQDPRLIAVPEGCTRRNLSRLARAAHESGVSLEFASGTPSARNEMLQRRACWAALLPAPDDDATWSTPLGLGFASRETDGNAVFIDAFRARRGRLAERRRRLWIQVEDAVPHIRGRVSRIAEASGLAPVQVAVAQTAVATAEVYNSSDALLCSESEAGELELSWQQLADIPLQRGYRVAAQSPGTIDLLTANLREEISCCLGEMREN